MARPAVDFELDPVVVPIPDDNWRSVDEWLESLRRDEEPIELSMSGADLVAEARHESE